MVSYFKPQIVEIMYLKNVHDEKCGGREKAHDQLFFVRKKLKTNRRQHFVVYVKKVFDIDGHLFKLKRIQQKQYNHRIDDHYQMEHVECFAPELVQYLKKIKWDSN